MKSLDMNKIWESFNIKNIQQTETKPNKITSGKYIGSIF